MKGPGHSQQICVKSLCISNSSVMKVNISFNGKDVKVLESECSFNNEPVFGGCMQKLHQGGA